MSLKESNEITVKIKCELNEFYKIVKEKGFKIIDKFSMDDTYFIPEEVDLDKINTRDILSKAVLVRDIKVQMQYRIFYPVLFQFFHSQPFKQFFLSLKIGL